MRLRVVLLAALGFLIVSVPLIAHHGNAAFENAKTVTVKATVTEWVWSNPHCFLKFDVKDDQGNVVNWVERRAIRPTWSPVAGANGRSPTGTWSP